MNKTLATTSIQAAHDLLHPDIRNVKWVSDCGSEIFITNKRGKQGVRIGHFQGDASIAAFVVLAHNQALENSLTISQSDEQSHTEKTSS